MRARFSRVTSSAELLLKKYESDADFEEKSFPHPFRERTAGTHCLGAFTRVRELTVPDYLPIAQNRRELGDIAVP